MQPPDFFLAWNVQLHIFWSPDVSLTSFQRHRPSQQAFHVPLFVSTTIESQLGGDFFGGEVQGKAIFGWCIHFLNLFLWSAWVLWGIFLNLPTFKREWKQHTHLFRWGNSNKKKHTWKDVVLKCWLHIPLGKRGVGSGHPILANKVGWSNLFCWWMGVSNPWLGWVSAKL